MTDNEYRDFLLRETSLSTLDTRYSNEKPFLIYDPINDPCYFKGNTRQW
jgi:hypothetical protein